MSPKTNRSSNKNTQEFRGGISILRGWDYFQTMLVSPSCISYDTILPLMTGLPSTSPMKRKKEGPEAKDPLFSISYAELLCVYIYIVWDMHLEQAFTARDVLSVT